MQLTRILVAVVVRAVVV